MKKIILAVFLLTLNAAFAQWTKVAAVRSLHIIALSVHNGLLYAASDSNIIYRSVDGTTWRSINVSNIPVDVSAFIFYNGKIYVGSFTRGVFVSADDGSTWQNSGLFPPAVNGFANKDNVLYAPTLGSGAVRFDPASNSWSFFNNALPDYSANVQNIVASSNYLIIAAGANGTYYRYNFAADEWNEEYYLGGLRPGLQIDKLINLGDTLWAVNGNHIFKSIDAALNWTEDKN